nr:MAG TPA: hypothetical protein [Caudoviricetes sp.]
MAVSATFWADTDFLTLRGLVYTTIFCYLDSAGYMRCIHGIPN